MSGTTTLNPLTLVVTGGAGFIGSALIRHLIQHTPHRVVNVDCLTYAGNLDSLAEVASSNRYRLERVDIRDPDEIRRVFEDCEPDVVMHLAAESHVDRSIDAPSIFLETNVVGTSILLEATRRLLERLPEARRKRFRFLHVSTDEVFGSAEAGTRFTETSPYAPNSPYAASKAAADHLVRAWGRTYGLPVLTTSCSNNYGPCQFPEKLIPHTIVSALEDRELTVYGDGGQVRDWLHVEDHVRALLTVLLRGRPGSYYNIGADSERTNLEVVHAICDILDRERPRGDGRSHRTRMVLTEDRPGHDRRYAIDASRVRRELDWTPAVRFEEGLNSTVLWYLENPVWWQPLRERVYGGERLGLGSPISDSSNMGP